MAKLDAIGTIQKYDRAEMLGIIESFPKQCNAALAIGQAFDLPAAYRAKYRNIVCTGLGGSAIGSDIARSYLQGEAKIPLIVNRNYTLPAFVNSETLVIAASYSGNTEETLSAYRDARAKGARIIAITSGGELGSLAEKDGCAVITIPPGLPPRCALGYSFFPLLILLSKLGIVPDKSKEIEQAISGMDALRNNALGHHVPQRKNIAKKIAQGIFGKFPVIYGGQDRIDAVVTRWRGQIAENAKTLASNHVFPEMNHNEIVGWEYPPKVLKSCVVLMLRDADDSRAVSRRMDITGKILKNQGVKVIEVQSQGKGLLARIFSLVYTGDFVSFYLAILNRCDPTPVERIAYLKKELAKRA